MLPHNDSTGITASERLLWLGFFGYWAIMITIAVLLLLADDCCRNLLRKHLY